MKLFQLMSDEWVEICWVVHKLRLSLITPVTRI